jgi:type IV pilus assembly protein PilC
MPIYAYQAKQMDGRTVKGEIDASSEVEARVKIRAQQMIPIKVMAGGGGGTSVTGIQRRDQAKAKGVSGWLIPKVKTKDLKIFTRQFATLINSGIAVVQSLELLERSSSNIALKMCLGQIRQDISTGKKLADSMGIHEKVFDRLYVNLVRAGEEAGVLDTILNRLAIYIEKSVKIKNKVLGALYYPAGIMFVAALVVFVIMKFVIPKFEELFKSTGQSLPAPTQFVIDMSHAVQSYGWMFVLGIAGAIYAIKQYYATDSGRYTLDNFMLSTPIFGTLLQKSAVARFTSTLSTLLTCGVGILDALEISARVSGNAVIERTLLSAKKVISEGKSIVQPLSQDKYIPDMVTQMIAVGEQTGAMDVMLSKIADFYEEEVDAAVAALTSVIEPIMMVFLGGLIGGIVIAMYLPIFNIASTVK